MAIMVCHRGVKNMKLIIETSTYDFMLYFDIYLQDQLKKNDFFYFYLPRFSIENLAVPYIKSIFEVWNFGGCYTSREAE